MASSLRAAVVAVAAVAVVAAAAVVVAAVVVSPTKNTRPVMLRDYGVRASRLMYLQMFSSDL